MNTANISDYERVLRTRRNGRTTSIDFIESIFTDFTELHGDRRYGDDRAVIGGIGKLFDKPVTVIGIEKGRNTSERIYRGFGCVLPEGYRKALRLIKEAEKFSRPVICFVDTQGANCGMGAEQRGEGSAIAENLYELSSVKTPIISIMIGEGGSGGALALAVADEVWMLENAYYSVISPEACASILFKDSKRANEAAGYLKLTAQDLYRYEVIEQIISEPDDFNDKGQVSAMMQGIQNELYQKISIYEKFSKDDLLDKRYEKYRKIGRNNGIY